MKFLNPGGRKQDSKQAEVLNSNKLSVARTSITCYGPGS